MEPITFLGITTLVLLVGTLVYVSSKTGAVAYSIQSATRKNQPKFEIRKGQIGRFLGIEVIVLAVNIIYCLIVMGDIHEIGAALIMSTINAVVIGCGLAYGVLLQEKKDKSS
jgi:hypothetical protein